MTDRVEFSGKVKDQEYKRADGKCRKCGVPVQPTRERYDHILPCALGGQATLANCQLLCAPCHDEKTSKEDIPRIRKADRQRKAHIGAKPAPSKPMQSASFPKAPPQRKASTLGPKTAQIRAMRERQFGAEGG